jgi:putative ABC transport system permease protein
MLSSFWQDLRFALRILIKSPGYTCIAVSVLALGIGANVAVFSVVDAVLLRPLPYPQPDRLAIIHERLPLFESGSVSYPNYLDWRAGQRAFTDLALTRRNSYNVSYPSANGAPPERVPSADVTANYLTILGLHPAAGRDFSVAEDTPGGPKAVMLGDALWRRRFGADRHVVGQRIMVDGVSREIIGVAPPEVQYPRAAELFVPLGDLRQDPNLIDRRNHAGFACLGRLKPGVSLPQAQQDLNSIAAELERRYPDSNTGRRLNVKSMLNATVGDYRQSLYLLLGAVGCVLLIACANAANLQLARSAAREKELAVRAALGAGRWRLMRQMLTESAVLGILGGGLALLLALWAMDAIIALSPANAPRFHQTHLDFAALGFTAAVALGTGLLVGIWPAWRVSGLAAMASALHEGSARGGTGGAGQQRTRALLVVAQVALAMVLLAGAGLTLKGFWRAQTVPLGFRSDGLLMMSVSLPEARYPKEKIGPFYSALLERIRALPGVVSAATGNNVPFDDNEWDSSFHITGTPAYAPGKEPQVEVNFASPDYFKTVGIPVLRGREFDSRREIPGQPRSVVIDETFARKYFPGQDPIGKHIDDNQTRDQNPPPLTVVGVVGHTLNQAPGSDPVMERMVQMHFCANQGDETDTMLMIRVASGDPMRLAEPARREVLALDPELPVADVNTMEANIAASLAPRRLTMVLLGTFAVLALVLASIGLYGVMALGVTQRTREMGIRLALGAQRRDILNLMLGQGARLIGIGLAVGLAGALALSRAASSLLYGFGGSDPATLACVALLLAAVALLASYLPARRAMRIDPLAALREE